MAQVIHKPTLRELRIERGLTQPNLGGTWTVVQVEAGRRLPGPSLLSKWAAILGLPPITVMAACRESQRRALVARGRKLSRVVRGRVSNRGSCSDSTGRGAAKVQQ